MTYRSQKFTDALNPFIEFDRFRYGEYREFLTHFAGACEQGSQTNSYVPKMRPTGLLVGF
jgi:hypothetical protein